MTAYELCMLVRIGVAWSMSCVGIVYNSCVTRRPTVLTDNRQSINERARVNVLA